jgi:hypothetical protein
MQIRVVIKGGTIMYFERYETRPGLTLNRIKEILWETIKTFGEERLPLWTRNMYGLIHDREFVIGDNNNMEIKCISCSGTKLDTHVRIDGPSYDSTYGMGVCLYVNCSTPFIKITEKYIIYRPDKLGRMLGDKDYRHSSWLVGDTLKDFVSLIITTFQRKYHATYTYRFKQDNVFDGVDIFGTVSKVLETFLNDKIDNLRLSNNIDIRNDPTGKLRCMFARNKETYDVVSHIEFSQSELHNITKNNIFINGRKFIFHRNPFHILSHTPFYFLLNLIFRFYHVLDKFVFKVLMNFFINLLGNVFHYSRNTIHNIFITIFCVILSYKKVNSC